MTFLYGVYSDSLQGRQNSPSTTLFRMQANAEIIECKVNWSHWIKLKKRLLKKEKKKHNMLIMKRKEQKNFEQKFYLLNEKKKKNQYLLNIIWDHWSNKSKTSARVLQTPRNKWFVLQVFDPSLSLWATGRGDTLGKNPRSWSVFHRVSRFIHLAQMDVMYWLLTLWII